MIIKLLKPFSFLPAIFLMYMIYSFSAQDGATSAQLSYQVSYKIVEVGGEVFGADLQPWEVDKLATRFHTPVRKLAHMTEYFLLAIAVAFPLYVYGLRGILLLFAAGVICVGFACGDEYHQAHVAGRGPSKRDVLIDSIGVFFGIVLVRIIGWTGRNTIFRPFSRKKENVAKMPQSQPYPYPPNPQNQPPAGYARQAYPAQRQARQPLPPQSQSYAGYVGQPHSQENYYYELPPHETYPEDDFDFYEEDAIGTSDRLSEDMSFRKLVNDLKDQKQARRGTAAKARPKRNRDNAN